MHICCKPRVNMKQHCGVNSMECATAIVHGAVMQMLLEIVIGTFVQSNISI